MYCGSKYELGQVDYASELPFWLPCNHGLFSLTATRVRNHSVGKTANLFLQWLSLVEQCMQWQAINLHVMCLSVFLGPFCGVLLLLHSPCLGGRTASSLGIVCSAEVLVSVMTNKDRLYWYK